MKVFKILILVALVGKLISSFFFRNEEINSIFNIISFSLIGIAYCIIAFSMEKNIDKVITIICGVYLIVMSFINDSESVWVSAMGLIAIVLPWIMFFFSNRKNENIIE